MKRFGIDSNNNITALKATEQIPEGQESFATQKELAKLAANWPSDRLVQVWNSFAGVTPFDDLKPVKKFTDRKTATTRIWSAIQKLAEATEMEQQRAGIRQAEADLKAALQQKVNPTAEPTVAEVAPPAADVAPKKAKATKAASTTDGAPTAREGSKKAIVLDLLRRKDGATLAEIAKATDWQNHSIRGFISGAITKKMGIKVESTKNSTGERCYRIAQ